MKILIIKTSSMGDVLHALPALSDAQRAIPGLECHWVVEEAFSEIPAWHPSVTKVIPLAIRRWRKNILNAQTCHEFTTFIKRVREERYDVVIDAQGLLKSAWIMHFAKGPTHGLDRHSAREALASLFYTNSHRVEKGQHAVMRVRLLFSKALSYSLPSTPVEYAIDRTRLPNLNLTFERDFVVLLHATTWQSKQYPLPQWKQLAEKVSAAGKTVVLPWGEAASQAQAKQIADSVANTYVLDKKLSLAEMATLLTRADSVISVDTGLAHLAAALDVPTVSLYGPTDPKRTGTLGRNQVHLSANFSCAPCLNKFCHYEKNTTLWSTCFETIPVERILEALHRQ